MSNHWFPTSTTPASPVIVVNGDADGAIPVSGTVSVSNLPAVQPISGTVNTNFSTAQPVVSTLNSSASQLGANGVFAGTGEDVSSYVSIDFSLLSDQASASQGLLFQFSIDGTIWDFALSFTIIANQGVYYSLAPRAKYFRVTYTNGATPTTTLRFSTVFYGTQRSLYQTNVDSHVLSGQGVDIVKAVGAATLQGSSPPTYVNLQANSQNMLVVDASQTVQPISLSKSNTYSAAIYGSTVATPGFVSFFFIITGSVSKIIRITKIGFSGLKTTAGEVPFGLYRLTSVTGGTPMTISIATHDSLNTAATATVSQYASGSTPNGTNPTPFRFWNAMIPTSATASQGTQIEETFGSESHQEITLRGATDSLALTLIGGLPAGLTINAFFEWTES